MLNLIKSLTIICILLFWVGKINAQNDSRQSFNDGWVFYEFDSTKGNIDTINSNNWNPVQLPHDWSIYHDFSKSYATTPNQGALPGGIGWYAKKFKLPNSLKNKFIYVDFDGIYRNSEVWINGHFLGKRPNGYISFRYDLSPYLLWNGNENRILVKVDNSKQPESRWYTGAGIYRNVWLITNNAVQIKQWGTYVEPEVEQSNNALIGSVTTSTSIENKLSKSGTFLVKNIIYNKGGIEVASEQAKVYLKGNETQAKTTIVLNNPELWSPENPNLYRMKTYILNDRGLIEDSSSVNFGFRHIYFDRDSGFFLNYKWVKIKGVCLHHDAGSLGAVVNFRAIERQLQILKEMGCNAIRTSHNAPAPELLDLCDKMGFLVMDEVFDMWAKKKNKFDYHLDFPKWHKQDLQDQILRDRNHPSIFMWSIGNEIREQFDSSGTNLTKELVRLTKQLDTSRPITSALTEMDTTKNFIYQAQDLDVLGWNYNEKMYPDFLKKYPGQKFIASETVSALESRGHYDTPENTTMFWPANSKEKYVVNGNADYTVSAYDNVAAYWGSSHEETWKIIKKYPFLSGTFVWTGFDYLGEPTPYPFPARSSYFGIVDLAGFPKDVYYMYQSEWSDKNVLHLLPHWNWESGKIIDVWAYYNNADEVELYLNGKSQGIRKKQGDDLHVSWKVSFVPGTLKAVSRKSGKVILTKEIKTAGKPAKILLSADRTVINADGKDLSYVIAQIVDKDGIPVPTANDEINFSIEGLGTIVGTDNGYQADTTSLKRTIRKAFNGKCIAIIQSNNKQGLIQLKATSPAIGVAIIKINSKK